MRDNRTPYHLCDGSRNMDGKWHTYCDRWVARERLIGRHAKANGRICRDCRKVVLCARHGDLPTVMP